MSLQTNIVEQFKSVILANAKSLNGRIDTFQNIEEVIILGDEFIRFSFNPSTIIPSSTTYQVRVLNLQIDYYKKSGNRAKIKPSNDLKEIILNKIPFTNRPYWYYAQCIEENNTPEFSDRIKADQYEGFQLIYEIRMNEQITCNINDPDKLLDTVGRFIYDTKDN